jgi:sortase A
VRHVRLRRLERTLYAIAAVALLWYAGVHLAARQEQAALAAELEHSRATLAAPASSSVSSRRVSSPPAPRSLVGRIDVKRLKLSALAREGVDARTLRASAGHVPGSALPGEVGNAAFAAHRDTFFRPLKGVRHGDEISVTTTQGQYTYVVSDTRVVDPSDVSVLRASADPTLTLVTCYPFDYVGAAPKRFIVSARLVQSKPRV